MAIYVSSKTFISSRGHNLPWKLKVRWRSEVIRKKVYVCPEPTCIHHNPARALGDLTGMKKHFCRKYRDEKIWNATSAPRSMLLNQIAKHIQRFTASGTSSVNVALIYLCRRKEGFAAHIAMCDALALLKEKEKEVARRALMAKLVSVNPCSFSSLPINNNSALFQELIIKKLPNLELAV